MDRFVVYLNETEKEREREREKESEREDKQNIKRQTEKERI